MEITETALIQDIDAVSATMQALKEKGCRTAIDDFGAGYTSFRNLQRLPLDIVKIDGSFIRDLKERPQDVVFVKMLIELARNFGIETVAEMVENRPTATELQELGVDYLQGYHFGRPEVPPAALAGRAAPPVIPRTSGCNAHPRAIRGTPSDPPCCSQEVTRRNSSLQAELSLWWRVSEGRGRDRPLPTRAQGQGEASGLGVPLLRFPRVPWPKQFCPFTR